MLVLLFACEADTADDTAAGADPALRVCDGCDLTIRWTLLTVDDEGAPFDPASVDQVLAGAVHLSADELEEAVATNTLAVDDIDPTAVFGADGGEIVIPADEWAPLAATGLATLTLSQLGEGGVSAPVTRAVETAPDGPAVLELVDP